MKKKIIVLLLVVFAGLNLNLLAQTTNTSGMQPVLEVYYFHATNRCPTCLSIEDNTRKTLDASFGKEVKEGKIKLIVLNSEEEKNKLVCEKYEVARSALLLIKKANGKETKEDMTNFAFSYSRNQSEKFKAGLKEKIQQLIN